MYKDGSQASVYKLSVGDVRKAPKAKHNPEDEYYLGFSGMIFEHYTIVPWSSLDLIKDLQRLTRTWFYHLPILY